MVYQRRAPGGVLPVVGYTGRLHPKGVPFLSSQYIKARVDKIAILVYERVTKSAAEWKKWWLKRSISKGATSWQKSLRN